MAHGKNKPNEHIPVLLRADTAHLSEYDRKALHLLADAVRLVNPVYLAQMKQNLLETGGVFDTARGTNFYPEDLTREELEKYIEEHPTEKEALLSSFTVVERSGNGLKAVSYAELYRNELFIIAQKLEKAAELISHVEFKNFLKGRAKAFRTNAYKENDKEWVRCVGAPFELILGPFESYEDSLRGIKRDFEGILGVVLEKENVELQQYQQLTAEFDVRLGKKYGYAPVSAHTPMTVIDEVIASGGSYYGFIPMACNLPNDKDIHETAGSKKTFVHNVIRAKFDLISTPIAKRALIDKALAALDADIYFKFIVGHELSHGLGFHFDGKDFLDLGSPLEEARADVFGTLFLFSLADRGIIAKDAPEKAVIMHAADSLRQIRSGPEEAHAVGSIIQYQWLLQKKAIRFSNDKIDFDPKLFHEAFSDLGDEFYKLAASRDHGSAKKFIGQWGTVPLALHRIIKSLEGLPVDIDPVFEY